MKWLSVLPVRPLFSRRERDIEGKQGATPRDSVEVKVI